MQKLKATSKVNLLHLHLHLNASVKSLDITPTLKILQKKIKITTIKIISTGLELLDKILGNLGLKDF